VALVLSGGNIDVNIVSRVIERGLVKDGRRVQLSVVLSDRPGALARLCAVVAAERANVLDIGHDRAFSGAAIGETEVVLTLETSGREHIVAVVAAVRAAGYNVREASRS
jgi:threonine dehydratase